MSKQVNFFLREEDVQLIGEILKASFDDLVIVPWHKSDLNYEDFEIKPLINTTSSFSLAERSMIDRIVYKEHEDINGKISYPRSLSESPILEYLPPFIGINGNYLGGRFYCCSSDKEFYNKISKFLLKLKRKLIYVKKLGMYISPSFDISKDRFKWEGIVITEDDLPKKRK